jgi:hypothetical protein
MADEIDVLLKRLVYLEMGLVPMEKDFSWIALRYHGGNDNLLETLRGLPHEEAVKAKRKFRKAWRKAAKVRGKDRRRRGKRNKAQKRRAQMCGLGGKPRSIQGKTRRSLVDKMVIIKASVLRQHFDAQLEGCKPKEG